MAVVWITSTWLFPISILPSSRYVVNVGQCVKLSRERGYRAFGHMTTIFNFYARIAIIASLILWRWLPKISTFIIRFDWPFALCLDHCILTCGTPRPIFAFQEAEFAHLEVF